MFWPQFNPLEWRKSVLAQLKWLGMEKIGGMDEEVNCDWNGFEGRKSGLAQLE
jgi:hypothetical protein